MNRYKSYCIFYLTCFIYFLSCKNKEDASVKNALEFAGNNSIELMKVIKNYEKKPSDSLKLKAAKYLISNMPGQISYRNEDVKFLDSFSNALDSLVRIGDIIEDNKNMKITELYNSLEIDQHMENVSWVNDIDVINSKYIIDNIDYAFYAWQTFPWSKNVTFPEFCENVLPYNIYNEPITINWRKEIIEEYSWVIDSIKNKTSLKEATILINNSLRQKMSYAPAMKRVPRALSFHNLKKSRFGVCDHLVTYNTYVLRAMGIPALIDSAPSWGNNSSGHTWGAIKDENGKLFTFDAIYTDSKIEDLESTNVIPEGVLRNRKTPKVYRLSYASQVQPQTKYIEVPKELSDVHRKDVTREYNFKVVNLNLKLDKNPNVETLYLCVYNTNEWKLCVSGYRDKFGNYQFNDLGSGIIYLPVIYKNSSIKPISSPFLLTDSINIKYITPKYDIKQTLLIDRKSNIDYDLLVALKSTIGGVFQSSNDEFFKTYENLFIINSMPVPKNNIFSVNDNKYHRYFRYLKPSGLCRVAELGFYGTVKKNNGRKNKKDIQLQGRLYSSTAKVDNGPQNVNDKNVLSYFVSNADSCGYIAVDIGKSNSAKITKIAFYPPNDGNTVEIGDEYELFYWDDDWVSVKRQIAKKEELVFDNCPSNALFRLRNLTKGYKERIFTYENGAQVWW